MGYLPITPHSHNEPIIAQVKQSAFTSPLDRLRKYLIVALPLKAACSQCQPLPWICHCLFESDSLVEKVDIIRPRLSLIRRRRH